MPELLSDVVKKLGGKRPRPTGRAKIAPQIGVADRHSLRHKGRGDKGALLLGEVSKNFQQQPDVICGLLEAGHARDCEADDRLRPNAEVAVGTPEPAVRHATGKQFPGSLELLSQRPDLPSSLADLLAGLLADAPGDRPGDAGAVLALLDLVRQASNISALIAAGESDQLEFKSSLHHAHGPLPNDLRSQVDLGRISEAQAQKEVRKRLNNTVTKTIAAFMNSQGGTLLIGVADSGAVTGIEADFPYVRKRDADGWRLSLKDVVSNAVRPEAWDAISVSLVRHEDALVAVLQCPRRPSETWHHDGKECFYIRTSSASVELTGPGLVRYIREHWPA